MARLGRLVGRGRAPEILLGGDDIPADLAAAYGYVNRVVPDSEIEAFTDAFARRIAAFDKVAVAGIKGQVDVATLPDDEEFAACLRAYFATAGRPENRPFTELLLSKGLQQTDGVETHLGTTIGGPPHRRGVIHDCAGRHRLARTRAPRRGDRRLRDGDHPGARRTGCRGVCPP
jgi:hypothetical protein